MAMRPQVSQERSGVASFEPRRSNMAQGVSSSSEAPAQRIL